MINHLAIILKKNKYFLALYSADGLLASVMEGSMPTGLGAWRKAKFLRKRIGDLKEVKIESVTLIPGSDEVKEYFINMSVEPTDDFMQMMGQKVSQLDGSGVAFYKMIYEKPQNRVDYLLSVVLLDPMFYKGIQRFWIKKVDFRWLMIPRDYACLYELISLQYSMKAKTLWMLFDRDHTLLIHMDEKEVKMIKKLSFGKELLAKTLQDAHFSENQIKQILTFELNFLTYHEMDRAIAFRMMIDHFLEDVRHQIHVLRDNMNVSISQIGLLSDVFSAHKIEAWLENMLKIPACKVEAMRSFDKVAQDDRFLFQAVRSEMEGRYLPVSDLHQQVRGNMHLIVREESIVGLGILGIALMVWLTNLALSIWLDHETQAAERARARVFNAKQVYQEKVGLQRKQP